VNPEQTGTKVGALHDMNVESGAKATVRLRLSPDNGATARFPRAVGGVQTPNGGAMSSFGERRFDMQRDRLSAN
jgi:hypothetical protein